MSELVRTPAKYSGFAEALQKLKHEENFADYPAIPVLFSVFVVFPLIIVSLMTGTQLVAIDYSAKTEAIFKTITALSFDNVVHYKANALFSWIDAHLLGLFSHSLIAALGSVIVFLLFSSEILRSKFPARAMLSLLAIIGLGGFYLKLCATGFVIRSPANTVLLSCLFASLGAGLLSLWSNPHSKWRIAIICAATILALITIIAVALVSTDPKFTVLETFANRDLPPVLAAIYELHQTDGVFATMINQPIALIASVAAALLFSRNLLKSGQVLAAVFLWFLPVFVVIMTILASGFQILSGLELLALTLLSVAAGMIALELGARSGLHELLENWIQRRISTSTA